MHAGSAPVTPSPPTPLVSPQPPLTSDDHGSHRLKEISGASNNCWWRRCKSDSAATTLSRFKCCPRSAWAAAVCHHAQLQVRVSCPISVFLLRFDYCHQPDELAKAVSEAVQGDCSDDDAARQGCCALAPLLFSCLKTRPAGIELLHSMACSVRDVGVESIFTTGSAGGDWQQRQHPSDLVLQLTRAPLPGVQHDAAGGGAADAADKGSVESAYDAETRHSAECIAAVTARVLRQRGVDEATICDAVRTPQLHPCLHGVCCTHRVAGVRQWHRR